MKIFRFIPILFLSSVALAGTVYFRNTPVAGGSSGTTYTYVQSNGKDGTGSSDTIAYNSNVTANSLLVLGVRIGAAGTGLTTVTDTQGNTWTRIKLTSDASGQSQDVWWAKAGSSAANTVTVNQASGQSWRFIVAEYSGATNPAVDVSTSAVGSSTTPDSQSATPTVDNSLAVSFCSPGSDATFTEGSGYTKRQTVTTKISLEDKGLTSATATNGTWTISPSDTWISTLVIFK